MQTNYTLQKPVLRLADLNKVGRVDLEISRPVLIPLHLQYVYVYHLIFPGCSVLAMNLRTEVCSLSIRYL